MMHAKWRTELERRQSQLDAMKRAMAVVRSLPQSHPQLASLTLCNGCSDELGDAVLVALFSSLPCLTDLTLCIRPPSGFYVRDYPPRWTVTDATLQTLATKCPRLSSLKLVFGASDLCAEIPDCESSLHGTETLALTDAALHALGKLPLSSLRLSGVHLATTAGLEGLCRQGLLRHLQWTNPKVDRWGFSDARWGIPSSLTTIARSGHLLNLCWLDCIGTVGNGDLCAVGASCPSLQHLRLWQRDSWLLKGGGLANLAHGCPLLVSLEIARCDARQLLSDDVFLALASLKSLEVLVLGRIESRGSKAIPVSGACLRVALPQMTRLHFCCFHQQFEALDADDVFVEAGFSILRPEAYARKTRSPVLKIVPHRYYE